jgi:hypothetical protein
MTVSPIFTGSLYGKCHGGHLQGSLFLNPAQPQQSIQDQPVLGFIIEGE